MKTWEGYTGYRKKEDFVFVISFASCTYFDGNKVNTIHITSQAHLLRLLETSLMRDMSSVVFS
jgi:hypothetical protein